MKWWIIEDALRDQKGHWLEYITTFRRGLMALGDEVRIFASRECEPELLQSLSAEPRLPRSIWARISKPDLKCRRILRLPQHGLATFLAMRRLFVGLRKEEVPDILFVPTVWVHHLIGWWLLLKAGFLPQQTRLLLFFSIAPVFLTDEGRGEMTPDSTGKLFRWLIQRIGSLVRQGRVVLGAETHAMQRALSEATGVKFTYLPHPVEAAPTNHCQPFPASPSRPLIFGCYGGARWEKGSDVLQAAIRILLKKEPEIPAKFAFQWIEDFDDEYGRRVTLDPWLAGHPKVEVIRRYFREGEYAKRLAQTDVMVLPYRSPYRLRVSRVAIEALTGGIPVISTRGSTLAEQARGFGAIVELDEISSLDLARCLQKAIRNHKALRKIALEMMEKARCHFSISNFREKLLGVRV